MCSSIRNYCKFKFQILGNKIFTQCILILLQNEMKVYMRMFWLRSLDILYP